MKNVLIVDDESTIRSVMELILSRKGLGAASAKDPDEARKLLASRQFDLILLDVKLGSASGLEFLRELREEAKINTPVVMMSGLADTDRIKEASKFGIRGFLLKPFNAKTVEEKVASVLEPTAAAA